MIDRPETAFRLGTLLERLARENERLLMILARGGSFEEAEAELAESAKGAPNGNSTFDDM